ncbi:sensor histidine kinase [Rathayibacter soli]|uniref:sensor histidine kinase n=1 Tax=Rathayibacter soli TaxID=3144168 RepID=UPI0027E4D290|nr:ATP-binding protein [Glaciibacter superstes]
MTQAASSLARRLRDPFRSWTLRSRLVLAVVALLAVLGLIIGLVSVLFLENYLIGRLDDQLSAAGHRSQAIAVEAIQRANPTADQLAAGIIGAPGQVPGTFVALIVSNDVVATSYLGVSRASANIAPQTISAQSKTSLIALPVDGSPTSVDLGGTLGDYRIVSVSLTNNSELVLGLPLGEAQSTVARLSWIIGIVTVIALAIAAFVGLLIVRLALRPLDRVAATATEVSELPLDRGEVALAVRVNEEDTNAHTEVGRVGAALNRMLGHVASALSARQASENKVRQFVADASHELRTPLASIRGYAELTRRTGQELPQEMVRSLGRIESEAQRMTGIVEDLLLLARLDEGRALQREPVDLSRLLVDALSDAHAAGPDHTWSIDVPGAAVEVIGDEPRLHQVVVNLLANARVHTPAGTAITATLATDGAHAVMTVLDDGPGIPEALQPVLFERFARGDSSRSRETGSTGLGLAIVQAVVAAQGGTVSVESKPGRTAFTVVLPLVKAEVRSGETVSL